MMITGHTTVHDGAIALLRDGLGGLIGVNPLGKAPHALVDLAKLNGSRSVVLDGLHEGRIEVAIVQEDVGVMIPAIEVALNRPDRLDNTFEFFVAGKDNERGIHTRGVGIGL